MMEGEIGFIKLNVSARKHLFGCEIINFVGLFAIRIA